MLQLRACRPIERPDLSGSALAAIGGFRSIAAEIVWFRADRLQEEGRYVELAQLASTLTFLEPHTPEVWSFAAWNLAYNISVMMPTLEDRWRWVDAAINLLRDDGLRLNPREAELYRELAWLFQVKIGADIDSAASIYRRIWRERVESVKARNAWGELKMNEEKMKKIEKATGLSDWGNPLLSAIYWAGEGLPYASGNTKVFLHEIIRQSLFAARKAVKKEEV
ncbi:MAG: hypothetical protein J6S51_02520 [Kiritimatiellae bacterium]|nr:hypothetical protein [Kiritimatiellia bacterium]